MPYTIQYWQWQQRVKANLFLHDCADPLCVRARARQGWPDGGCDALPGAERAEPRRRRRFPRRVGGRVHGAIRPARDEAARNGICGG